MQRPVLRRLTTAPAIVEELGGIHAVAKLTGASPKSVYHWNNTNMFPARAHDLMKKVLKKRGCTAPASLWNQIGARAA